MVRLRIGFQVWAQFVSWDELMAAGRLVEALGFDGLWSNDHLVPLAAGPDGVVGDLEGPIFEGWVVLAGWAAATERIRLGCLVSGAGYRNPALLVKMATSLDHMSGGRMTLGLGAGWFQREHETFGFDLPPLKDRLDRLEDAAAIARGLLDGEAVTHTGSWYRTALARNDPAPVQARLPLLIGGSGERRTLRIVARYADAWSADGGDPETLLHKNGVLDDHCRAIGRDPRAIRRTAGQPPALIRASRDDAVAALAEVLARHGVPWSTALAAAFDSPFVGSVDEVVAALDGIARAGIEEVMFDLPLPADRQTLDALAGPVRTRLARLLA
jgi:F420-dependent oxidoreductase-like protein